MAESSYYCNNCGARIKPTDIVCPKCGENLSNVGRRIEKTITETIRLSDNVSLGKVFTGSFANISGFASTASELVKVIPQENLKEIGVNEQFVKSLKNIEQNTKIMADALSSFNPLYVAINASNIVAPIQVSQQGNNIVVTTNVEESFNKISVEIEKMNIEPRIKEQAKLMTNQLKEETLKENPDKSKILKIWNEFKTLVPIVAPLLAPIISKVLLGV